MQSLEHGLIKLNPLLSEMQCFILYSQLKHIAAGREIIKSPVEPYKILILKTTI